MIQSASTSTVMYHEQHPIEVVAYSFSPYNQRGYNFTPSKVFLDILFAHPRTAEIITLRTVAPAHLLCSKKEEIETAVYREIASMLTFQSEGIAVC